MQRPTAQTRDLPRVKGAKPLADHVHAAEEVGPHPVELVDEAHARHTVFVRLPPDRLRLRLDPGDAVEHRHRTVEHAQRALHLDGEIDMARRVDDVDAVVVPETGGRGGGDRDAALLLLLHPVHRRGTVMHFADLVGFIIIQIIGLLLIIQWPGLVTGLVN